MVTHWKAWGSFSRRGDYDDGSGGVVVCHSFSPGPPLFCISPPSSPDLCHLPRGCACQVRKAHGRDRGVDCRPAPVSKVIFGCPLLLRVSRNGRMNQPMEEEKSSSSLSSYEESEVVRFRSGRRGARTSGDQGDLT